MKSVSVIVPTLNESENVAPLVERIDSSLSRSGIDYEIVFVDDHSQDGTQSKICQLANHYNVRLFDKRGQRGKAYSLLQGFEKAKHDTICMIDADLQYPPEEIAPMCKLMDQNNADVVITEREDHQTGKLRQLSSRVYNLLFARMLFGFNYDSQSGLKLFKKKVIRSINLSPTPWSFDLEFIVRSLEHNYKILNHKIAFHQRNAGEPKVRVLNVTYELIKASLSLRFNSSPKKVKEGYQRNTEFTKQAYGSFSTLTLIAGVLISLALSVNAMAADIPPSQLLPQSTPVATESQAPTAGTPSDTAPTSQQPTADTPLSSSSQSLAPPAPSSSSTAPSSAPTAPTSVSPHYMTPSPAPYEPASATKPTMLSTTASSSPSTATVAGAPVSTQPTDKTTYPHYDDTKESVAAYRSASTNNIVKSNKIYIVLGALLAVLATILLVRKLRANSDLSQVKYEAHPVHQHV